MGLLNYYNMLKAGYFRQCPIVPNGFENYYQRFSKESSISTGIVIDRSWQLLRKITPQWRLLLEKNPDVSPVLDALRINKLSPIVFSDVDMAVLSRDAQGHVDQYVADRATLEALGFVAVFYHELTNPEIQLSDIKGRAAQDYCFEIGQSLFHSSLQKIKNNSDLHVPLNRVSEFITLINKSAAALSDDDFRSALSYIEDSFYVFIVNPVADFVSRWSGQQLQKSDSHGGQNRMKLIYTTIAAFSHSAMKDDEKVRQKHFGDSNARAYVYQGVEELFGLLRSRGIDVVGITRGNQFPYMETAESGINELFTRVHSTMVASMRSAHYLDPLHPEKKIRSYSLSIDNMSTLDKVRIMVHESLEKFVSVNLSFTSEQDVLNALGCYLDHCIFITDADLEAWGTCPIVTVLALRTPTLHDVHAMFSDMDDMPQPIAIINPAHRMDLFHGFEEGEVFPNFSPDNKGMQRLVEDICNANPLRAKYSTFGGREPQSPFLR